MLTISPRALSRVWRISLSRTDNCARMAAFSLSAWCCSVLRLLGNHASLVGIGLSRVDCRG